MEPRRLAGGAVVAGALLLVARVSHADGEKAGVADDLDPSINLEQLLDLKVVTASGGVAEERSLTPASVVVFTQDDIARHGWRSVAEVLENVPGFDVTDDHVLTSVGVRGVTGGYRASTRIVKVMIDGMAVNFRPDLAAFIGPEYIPIDAVARVEVAKGPLSALYGANAFVAVVNVITIRAPDAPVATVSLRSNLIRNSLGYGASGMIAEKNGPLELVAAFSLDRIDRSGLSVVKTFAVQDPTQPRYASYFAGPSQGDISQPKTAFLALRLPSQRWGSLSVEGGVQELDSMAEFQLSSVLTHRSRMAIDNYWSQARYERSWLADRLHLTIVGGSSQGRPSRDEILYLTGNNDSSFVRNFRYRALDGGAQLAFSPFPSLSALIGADGSYEPQRTLYYTQTFNTAQGTNVPGDRVDLIGPTDARDVVLSNVGVYTQLGGSLPRLPSLRLTLNGRIDLPNLFPTQRSWRAAIAYRLNPSVTMKLFAGEAFQAPSATLLYGHPGFGAAYNVIGSLTRSGQVPLRPQVIDSVEAATNVSIANVLSMEASVYFQQVQDKIEFLQAGSDFIPRNAGTGKNVGLEASAQAVIRRLVRPYVAVAAQRTLLDGTLATAPPPLYPNYWVRGGIDVEAPEAHVRSALQIRWEGSRGASQSNVLLNNNTPYQLPAFAEVDAAVSTLGWRPFHPGPELTLTLRVRNLLDNRRPVPGFGGLDVPALGRVGMIELGYAH